MKKIIVFTLLFVSVTASAQNDVDTTAQPVITAMGISDGKKTEMMIGKEGGSFASSDGKLILFISEGTVSKKTTFSIQPITNLMPNGNGQAYRLEPSGIQFQKPVQLLFHYTEEESEDSMQLLLRIAMQDDEWIMPLHRNLGVFTTRHFRSESYSVIDRIAGEILAA